MDASKTHMNIPNGPLTMSCEGFAGVRKLVKDHNKPAEIWWDGEEWHVMYSDEPIPAIISSSRLIAHVWRTHTDWREDVKMV